MARIETVIRVFVASPGDIGEERTILEDVVRELNLTVGQQRRIRLELVKWETHAFPGVGNEPQAVINEQIGEDYDIFIGILWTRFGTPTTCAGSGTVEEFERALARFRQDPRQLRIMFYFKDAPPASLSEIDPDQFKKVRDFRSQLSDKGVLFWSFNDREGFANFVRIHLSYQMQDWGKKWGLLAETRSGFTPAEGPGGAREKVACSPSPPEPEEGLIDLLESGEERFDALNEIARRMTRGMERLGGRIRGHAEELNQAPEETPLNVKRVKNIVNSAAQDMEQFVGEMEQDIPTFGECYSNAIDTFGRAAALLIDFTAEDKTAVEHVLTEVSTLKSALDQARAGMIDFRGTVAKLPRITTAVARAKRRTLSVLDRLDREFTNALKTTSEVEKMIGDILGGGTSSLGSQE